MKYTDFIRDFSLVLNENGIRITQPKLKELFDLLGEYVSDNIKDEGKIPIKEFMSLELVVISPKKLPDGSWSDEQLSVKIKLSDKYKAELKNKLSKENHLVPCPCDTKKLISVRQFEMFVGPQCN